MPGLDCDRSVIRDGHVAIAVVQHPHREVCGPASEVFVVQDPPEEVGGHLAGVERAVNDERLLAAKEVVELVARRLRP